MANDQNSGTRDGEDKEAAEKEGSRESPERVAEGTRKEESVFSFKHFLKGSGDSAAAGSGNTFGTAKTAAASARASATTTQPPNLGARPKIPLNEMPRMKRSPKFPSFDSHASLSEYSEEVSSYVQRSHSNYEVETPSASSFGRRSPVTVLSSNPGRGGDCGLAAASSGNCNSPSGLGANRNEFSSALPDFVKDHLVFEQWYTNPFRASDANDLSAGSSPPSRGEPHHHHHHQHPIDLEPLTRRTYQGGNLFDLAMGSAGAAAGGPSSTFRLATNSPTVPLDLPSASPYDGNPAANERIPLDLPHHRFGVDRHHSNPSNNHSVGDLPLDLTDRHCLTSRNDNVGAGGGGGQREESPPPQVDMIQTLPDFLSDGPIHSSGRLADVAQDLPQLDSPEENVAVNVISRLRLENDRLRHELDEARRLISDQGRQISDLERSSRTGEIQRNGAVLEKNKLKQKIAQLTEEIGVLRHENESLREEDGAVGGNSSDCRGDKVVSSSARSMRSEELSRELNLAATTAEANLRQLLAGVGNLRLLARQVQNMSLQGGGGEHPIEDYISDCEDDDFLGGPAL